MVVTLEIHWLTREPTFSLVLYTNDHSTLVNMNVSKFYGRTKIKKCVHIKEITYNDSDDSDLASDSDTEKTIFSMNCSKNRIIPETDSECDDEAIHNETQQTTQQDAPSQSDSEKEERNEKKPSRGSMHGAKKQDTRME